MTAKIEKHLPEKAPKRTGRAGVRPQEFPDELEELNAPPEPPVPSSEDVAEFLDGVNSTREKRKAKKPEIVKPQEQRLPGMEDAAIEELEDSAKRYAQIRDKRMALTTQEVDCKDLLLTLMKRHGKKNYHHDGILITVVPEGEKIKVRVEED